ncbi:MAG: segregation/condensation protein A [Defluviitaleaceae bacterium]|nr:segregation/condensation protein A [Defluviitaleaceae bacterium]
MNFRLDAFEGPMDLLLHLLEKNEINIYDIPIAVITEQYLAHLGHIRKARDMASISEFVVMAATLLEIKSRMLLPAAPKTSGEPEVDPREELVNRLIEYKKYKRVTADFAQKQLVGERFVFRPPDSAMISRARADSLADLGDFLDGVDLKRLLEVCRETLRRKDISPDRPEVSYNVIAQDAYTVEDRMEYVLNLLAIRAFYSFAGLLESAAGRVQIIVTFIAVLELVRQQRVQVRQEGIFAEIMLHAV